MKHLSTYLLILLSFGFNFLYGQSWTPLDNQLNSTIYSATSFNSEIYVGGTQAIMKYNGSTFDTIGKFDSAILCLEVFNNELYATGAFTQVDGNTINGIARWDGSNWNPLGTGITPGGGFLIGYNNELYVTGYITTAGGISVSNIAKWDGSSWNDVSLGINGVGMNMEVYNSELYVLGSFSQAGGNSASNIAKWNGTSWNPVSTGISFSFFPYSPCIKSFNNNLFVSDAYMYSAGGVSIDYKLAKWDNSNWSSDNFTTNPGYSIFMSTSTNTIYGMRQLNGGQVYESSDGDNWSLENSVNGNDTLFLKGMFFANNKIYAYGEVYVNNQNYGILSHDLGITNGLTSSISNTLDINVYPNPFTNTFQINYSNPENISSVILCNSLGENIRMLKDNSSGNLLQYDCSDLNTGIYYLKILDNTNTSTFKIVKY